MLSLKNVSLRRGPRLLFSGVDLTVYPGQKVGVTGNNGSGKSSLLALIRGELHADAGDVSLPAGLAIASVAQDTPAVETPAIDFVMAGDAELKDIHDAIARAEAAGDGERLAHLHARLEAIDGYSARSRAARLLHGLGFGADQYESPVRSFSGGWRVRLSLAQALMCRSDLLLLDEPTNHLDLDAVIWLQDWLRGYPGTLLLISHDRDFLDEVLDHILHIEQGRVTLYNGNYSAFEGQRAAQLAQQQAAYVKQQREIDHMRRFVERFRAKATKARQAQSRLKALQRMETIAPAHVDSPFHFSLPAPDKLPTPLLRLAGVSAGYGGTPVLSALSLTLTPGDRLGLLGANGAGKSTLIKLLAGELAPTGGTIERNNELKIGYFAQHQLEQLRPDDSPLAHLRRLDRRAADQLLRNFLGGFGFSGDMALAPVAPFSGGEKARLALALLVYQRPNLLLLDEPTNHLDLEMRHALNIALQDYDGAMVVVSHDRYFLRTVTDAFILVDGGRMQHFEGDLDDYARSLLQQRESSGRRGANGGEHTAAARKQRRQQDAQRRAQEKSRRNELRRREQEMERLGREQHELETALADPALYLADAKDRLQDLLARQGRVRRALDDAEAAWLALSEDLDDSE